ncbi:MAG: hydrolase [Chloroflexi bacterium RBG_13_53_26]|nr:MAG: hydrolase [Chloroflexi bacterium RBG_13_53_26]
MLTSDKSVLVVIDMQGKLAQSMYRKELLFENVEKIIKGAQVLGIPMLLTEQNPKGLGPTIPEVVDLVPNVRRIPKLSFSCCGDELFLKELSALQRCQVLLTGIESHVCLYQTTVDLVASGYEVHVVADAVSSRTAENRDIGLQKMKDAGASITSVETVLFELLRVAEGYRFKEILNIVK